MKSSAKPILPTKVMIAGIGGASLGTEILKSLLRAGGYEIHGADIYPTTFGLYAPGFTSTYLLPAETYAADLIALCREKEIHYLIPGAEGTMVLLGNTQAMEKLADAEIRLVGNKPEIVGLCSDKGATFNHLRRLGIPVPRTAPVQSLHSLEYVGLPCIVKPSTNSGGSASVFYATSADEAMIYADLIRRGGVVPVAQEYIHDTEGEFTVGVLSLPDGRLAGSIALRRSLTAKLSVSFRGRGGVVSSGYSQGEIATDLPPFPAVRLQAEAIAGALGSCGPLNIQGRVRDGVFLPFEINPRFSASTYLRALAGFNEPDLHAVKQGLLFGGENRSMFNVHRPIG